MVEETTEIKPIFDDDGILYFNKNKNSILSCPYPVEITIEEKKYSTLEHYF